MADPRYRTTDLLYRQGGVPNPLAAALGLVASGVREARNLPQNAVRLPLLGLSYAVELRERARRQYADLVRQGLAVVALLRGEQVDEWAEAITRAETPPTPARPPTTQKSRPQHATQEPTTRTPRRTASTAAAALGAPGVATAVAERVTNDVHREFVPGDELSGDELPLVDYDHLTIGQLRARLRQLDAAQLVQLRDYEKAHANRLPILTVLENRIAKVNSA